LSLTIEFILSLHYYSNNEMFMTLVVPP